MSRVANVLLVVDPVDDHNVSDLSFWMASDADARADERTSSSVGPLMPLTGAPGEDLWGGHRALGFSAWGAVTNYLHWDRFLEQVAVTAWRSPGRFQLLVQSEADPYFRCYMFRNGMLTNVLPPPEGDQEWDVPD